MQFVVETRYTYAKCKSCKCVAQKEAAADAADDEPYDDDEGEGYVPYEEPVVEEELSFGERAFEWIDENGNTIFAVVFTLILVCVMVPALVLTTASGHKAAAPAPAKAEAAVPAPAKAAAKDSDDDDDDDDEPPAAGKRKKTPKAD